MSVNRALRRVDEGLFKLVDWISAKPLRARVIAGFLIALAVALAILIRTAPYELNGFEFLEFDSYIEYWQAKYVYDHGPLAWYTLTRNNPDTHIFWYPWGRDFIYTSYPFLPMWIGTTYHIVERAGLELRQWAALQPVIFAAIATVMAYLAAVEVSGKKPAGVLASLLYAILPAAVERSVMGYVEKEGVAAAFIFAFIYLYAKGLKAAYTARKGWIKYTIPAALSLSMVGWLWGGYIFLLGLVALYAALVPILCREHFTKEIALLNSTLVAFSLLFVTPSPSVSGTMGIFPFSAKGFGWAFLAITILPIAFYYLKTEYRKLGFKKPVLTTTRYFIILLGLFVAGLVLITMGVLPVGGRLAWALGLRFVGVHPLVESIAEHQSPLANENAIVGMLHSWGAYFEEIAKTSRYLAIALGIMYLFSVSIAGILYLLYKGTPEKVFVGVAFAVALYSYLNAVYMIGAASYFGVLVISTLVSLIASYAFPYAKTLLAKHKPARRKAPRARPVARVSTSTRVFTMLLLAVIVLEMASTASTDYYLNANRVYTFKAGLSNLNYVVTDSWYKAVEALRSTPEGSVVISWWDYGYGISVLGERASVADGSTLNATQIGIIGLIMWSNTAEEAARLAKLLAVKPGNAYLMVIEGVLVSEQEDRVVMFPIITGVMPGIVDWPKSIWMFRIGNATVDDLRRAGLNLDYLNSAEYFRAYGIQEQQGVRVLYISPAMTRSNTTPLVYKLVIDAAMYWAEEVKGKKCEFYWFTGDEQVMSPMDSIRLSIKKYIGIDVEKLVLISGFEALTERPLKNDTILQPYAVIVEPFRDPRTGEPVNSTLYWFSGTLYSVIAIYKFTDIV